MVTNLAGKSASATAAVAVVPPPQDDRFGVFCSGPRCGATSEGTYRGTGVGLWRYRNSTATSATIDLSISGVSPTNAAILVFSNGEAMATTPPSAGAAEAESTSSWVDPTTSPGDVPRRAPWHTELLKRNRALAAELDAKRPVSGATGMTEPPARDAPSPAAPPAVGTVRSWTDYGSAPSAVYSTTAATTCSFANGRNLVLWLDPNVTMVDGGVSTLTTELCRPGGGYELLTGLVGDVWGAAAASFPTQLIQDSPTLQDLNVVILNAPAAAPWAGYFYALNAQLISANRAVVLFINGPQAYGRPENCLGIALHEMTHMINFYQRSVAHGVGHDLWLEETTAMMTEDIVGPAASIAGSNFMAFDGVISYIYFTGGNTSLINWEALSGAHYRMGGGLGVFLTRRYGVELYRQLVGCGETPATQGTSYACMDAVLHTLGGVGFPDELDRFGISSFALLGDDGVPDGFGFPARPSGAFPLAGVHLRGSLPSSSGPLGATFPATTHTYLTSTITDGGNTYARTGLVVPSRSTFLLAIRPDPMTPLGP